MRGVGRVQPVSLLGQPGEDRAPHLAPTRAAVAGWAWVPPTVGAQPAMTPFRVANRNTAGALDLPSVTVNLGLPPVTVVLKAWPVG